jgi:hypothetical protein
MFNHYRKTLFQIKLSDQDVMSYSGTVTADIDRETLPQVDPETRDELERAADNYVNGPDRLKAAMIKAARKGDKPAAIARAIGYAHTYDFTAKLIREDRAANPAAYAPRKQADAT